MRGPNMDQMQRHQPTYLALKISAEGGCQLCRFFYMALEQGSDWGDTSSRDALSHVCEQYPGREISLVAWGGGSTSLDRIYIITTGEVMDNDDDAYTDPSMHPDHQLALDGSVDLYAYPGNKVLFCLTCGWCC